MRYALVLLALTTTAAAQPKKAKPIKAQFLCGVFVDGKIAKPITGGKVGKLADPIACAIHVDDPKEPSHMGNVHTVRYAVDPKSQKVTKVVSSGKTDDFGSQSDEGKHDFEVVMKPDTADENREVAWKPCEDFDIVATISDDLGVYFTKTIKVQQSCPKPKPIAAQLTCVYETSDGTLFRWPGNGAKLKPRLSSSRELDCAIGSGAALPADTKLTGTLVLGSAVKTAEPRDAPPHGWTTEFAFSSGDYDECANFTIEGKLVDGSGAQRWSGSLKIVQNCPD